MIASANAARMIKLDGKAIELHPCARPAYHAISAIAQLMPLNSLAASALLSLLDSFQLTVVEPRAEQTNFLVVGGFAAFHIFGALAMIGQRPKRVRARKVKDDPAIIEEVVQAELLAAVLLRPARSDSQSWACLVRLLTPENAMTVFNKSRPNHGNIANSTGVRFTKLGSPKRLVLSSDSGILSAILAEKR
jgi:hypothetical protein